jgi:hypothetical protein
MMPPLLLLKLCMPSSTDPFAPPSRSCHCDAPLLLLQLPWYNWRRKIATATAALPVALPSAATAAGSSSSSTTTTDITIGIVIIIIAAAADVLLLHFQDNVGVIVMLLGAELAHPALRRRHRDCPVGKLIVILLTDDEDGRDAVAVALSTTHPNPSGQGLNCIKM